MRFPVEKGTAFPARASLLCRRDEVSSCIAITSHLAAVGRRHVSHCVRRRRCLRSRYTANCLVRWCVRDATVTLSDLTAMLTLGRSSPGRVCVLWLLCADCTASRDVGSACSGSHVPCILSRVCCSGFFMLTSISGWPFSRFM